MGPETGDTSRDGETGRETGRDTYKDERDTVVRKNFKFGKRVHNEPRLHEHEVWDFLKASVLLISYDRDINHSTVSR